ncbi:MAG TPA: hypothetical protein PK636_01220 [bacterium]|nr:hypothetical protein [bacterium]
MEPVPPKRRRLLVLMAVLCLGGATFLGATAVYLVSVAVRALPIYNYIKADRRGWEGKVHAADPRIGFAPIPGSSGAHIFPVGPDIPMRYDADGCRIPAGGDPRAGSDRVFLLSLGCSYTYGDGCRAEDTFTDVVGSTLGLRTVNGGVCSYGLATMLLRARELIPRLRPEIVLVQWSPWLLSRAKSPFAAVYFGVVPQAYFYDTPEGVAIHSPVFRAVLPEIPFWEWRRTPASWPDFLSFLWRGAIPLLVHDDFHMLVYRLKKLAGLVPPRGTKNLEIVRAVYSEIDRLAREYGGKAVILYLPWQSGPPGVPPELRALGLPVVNAMKPLAEYRAAHPGEGSFRGMFAHYRGDPPRLVDSHPNPLAHRLIASEICRELAPENSSSAARSLSP